MKNFLEVQHFTIAGFDCGTASKLYLDSLNHIKKSMDSSSLQALGLGAATCNGSSFSYISLCIGDAEKMHVCGLTAGVLLPALSTMSVCPCVPQPLVKTTDINYSHM